MKSPRANRQRDENVIKGSELETWNIWERLKLTRDQPIPDGKRGTMNNVHIVLAVKRSIEMSKYNFVLSQLSYHLTCTKFRCWV